MHLDADSNTVHRFPNLGDDAEVILSGDGRERFETGCDRLIAGIAASAERST